MANLNTSVCKQIKIGIIGYGNIGKSVELAVEQNPDMVLTSIFTRRNPEKLLKRKSNIMHISELEKYINEINVAVLCGGSVSDLPEQGPKYASMFNTVDSYDTHTKIPEYFASINKAASKAGKTSIISTGWDPGLFSLLRLIEESTLPKGKSYTFWGPGVSQGHSNALRSIEGVKNAIQYTVPIEESMKNVRDGTNPNLTERERHRRICYIVPEEDANLGRIKHEIVAMPNYFEPYDTEVIFISEMEMINSHSKMPHGGFVIRHGKTAKSHRHLIEFSLKLDSNPEFTANVMLAYARAAYRLNKEGQIGAKTVFDVPPSYLSIRSPDELRRGLL